MLLIAALSSAAAVAPPLAPSLAAQSRDTSVQLSSKAVVDVTLRSGRLVVRGVNGQSGAVRRGGRDFQVRPSGVGLVVDDGSDRKDRGDRAVELDLPYGTRLIINAASADISVRDLRGDLEVHTQSGNIVADGIQGSVLVDAMSGDISLDGVITQLRGRTVGGGLVARGVRGDVDVRTTSGDIRIVGERAPRINAESMSGDIGVEGTLAVDARVTASSHTGDIVVRLPEDAKGYVDFSTVSGEFVTDRPRILLPGPLGFARRSRSSRHYDLGGGGPLQLELTTFSGDVRLIRVTPPQ